MFETLKSLFTAGAATEVENLKAAEAEIKALQAQHSQLTADIETWTTYRNIAMVGMGIASVYGLSKILKEPR